MLETTVLSVILTEGQVDNKLATYLCSNEKKST